MKQVYVVAGSVKGYYHLMQYVEDITGHPQQKSIEKRLEIIQFFEKYGKEATEIAYKKKRSTIFLWKQKLKKAGGKLSALAPGDRSPKNKRHRVIHPFIANYIVEYRTAHPRADKVTITPSLALACTKAGIKPVSESTVGRIIRDLKEKGRLPKNSRLRLNGETGKLREIKPRQAFRKTRRRGFHPGQPGDLVEIDTVSIFTAGIKRYMFTAIDIKTRFAFAYAYKSNSSANGKDFLNKFTGIAPFPIRRIQTDNGSEFLKHFAQSCLDNDFVHFFNYPSHPQSNGHIERFNRTSQEQFVDWYTDSLDDPDIFNRRLMNYLIWYNTEKPHRGIGKMSPLRYYVEKFAILEKSNMLWPLTRACSHNVRVLEFLQMISVVIPALNEEKYLSDCLKSLRNQDYMGPYEIIIADNGSVDETARIARDFGARVVSCPEKKSVFYARQIGADSVQGDIIAQADADTIYPRDWLSRIANRFEKHPEVVAVTGRYTYTEPPWWAKVEYAARNGINRLTVLIFRRPLIISGATFAFRRKTFLALGGYHGITYAPDQWGISSRLSKLGKISYDRDLCVVTSPRSVNKPLLHIFKEGIVNWGRWGSYQLSKPVLLMNQSINRAFRKKRIATVLVLVILAMVMLVIADGYFVPASPFFGKVYAAEKSSDKIIALTFDDGPNEPYTSEIINVLSSYNIKATFFVIGENAELYPDVVNEIISDGNVVGNYSYSYDANHALTSFGVKDMERAEDAIFSVAGVKPHLYCPPHGKKSPWELDGVKDAGMIEVTWDVSANDQHTVAYFGKPTPENYASAIVENVKPGSIIRLHDGHGTLHNSPKSDKSLTVQALPLIIKQLQAKGYQFVTVPALLHVPAYN